MKYVIGNVVEASEDIICHGCNAQGAMGSGVAKAIRDKWPEVYDKYRDVYFKQGLNLGDCVLGFPKDDKTKIIGNLITQKEFGTYQRQVNYCAISKSLEKMMFVLGKLNSNIAIPRIGAGLGGGDWNIIESILIDFEKMYDVEFVVYDLK